jgi:hypothetical protein
MRRILPVAIGLLIIVAGVGGLILFLQSRDDAGIEANAAGPGVLEKDLGSAHTGSAEPGSVSGPHQPDNVTRDARELSPDQIVHALELGDVVITYPQSRPPQPLLALQEDISGRFDAELAANGLTVILAKGEDLQALAWRRRLKVSDPADPLLREFAEHWLGVGAPGR